MRRIIISTLLSCAVWTISAQDKDVEAQVYYLNAERAFDTSGFVNCILELNKAEKALGATNSKILYLKVKALSNIYSLHYPLAYMMDTCLKAFFKITDAKKYPIEKYGEIINIKNKFNGFGNDLGPVFQTLTQKDYNQLPLYSLLLKFRDKSKKAVLAGNTEIRRDTIQFTNPVLRYNGSYYHLLELPAVTEPAYLYWYCLTISGEFSSWYMFDESGERKSYFKQFKRIRLNTKGYHSEDFSDSDLEEFIVQHSAIPMPAGKNVFLFFETSENEPFSLVASFNQFPQEIEEKEFFTPEKMATAGWKYKKWGKKSTGLEYYYDFKEK